MKKILSVFAILMMSMAIPQSVKAYDFSYTYQGQTLYYNIVYGEAQVTYQNNGSPRYTNLSGALVIPDTVTYNSTTYSVTSIGDHAFRDCSGLTSVAIPNSVTSIGQGAFIGCSGLTSVTIPNSVTSIGSSAFYGCSGLTSVTIPNSVTSIGARAFDGCSGLTSVTIPNSVTSIGSSAFEGCSGLTSVTIGNSVTSIGSSAFRDCSGLTSVTIGNSVTSIALYAFEGCSGLTSVTIPNSVTSIGSSAFSGCSGLTSVTIGNSVTSIGYSAFYGCSGLTSVTIPNSVTSIGSSTFSGCSGLTQIIVSSGNTHYDSRDNCNAIIETSTNTLIVGCQNTVIPNSVTSIGVCAFESCSGLTSVTIPNSVTSIGYSAFYGCSGLTSVTIPNSVTSIGKYAFYGCSGLTSVTIPNSVTSIGYGVFSGCSGLTQIVVSSGNTHYDSRDNCNAIVETSTNTLIAGCPNTVIPNSVTSIGNYAFFHCSGLTSVTIPNSVTSIGSSAFSGCSGLTSVTIGNSVTIIGESAFSSCSVLTEVTMLGEIAPTLGSDVFYENGSSRIIKIPCGSYDSYYNGSGWSSYRSALHEHSVDITLTIGSNDSIKGIANGGVVACDSSAIIRAIPNYGYHFDHWSNGNTANPDTLHLVGDSTVIAIFALNQCVLTVQSADESLGTVAGSGTYDYLDTVSISATANNHHHFVHWNDGNRDNPRQIVVTGDMIFSAYFAIDTHTVNVVTSDTVRGMVETTGTEFVYGTPCTVTATAYTGYIFAGWSNGVTANPYTFAVLSDVELTALFVAEGEDVYTVTVESADPTMGAVSGGGQALGGGTVTIRAAGNPGYHFLRWNDNNTDSIRTVEVHGNATYTAYFEADNAGLDEVDVINAKIYTIHGQIVVEGTEDNTVWLYDVNGRILAIRRDEESHRGMPLRFDVPASGTYLVKIGTHPARKVVVIR